MESFICSASNVLYAQSKLQALSAIAVDGRAGRSTWIKRHNRNFVVGRIATGLWRSNGACSADQDWVLLGRCAAGSAVLPATAPHSWLRCGYSIRRYAGSRRSGFFRFVAYIGIPCSGRRDIRSTETSGAFR
jgi:hypothetical protein